MYVEGGPALLGSLPTSHKARGVNCHKSGHYTPHDQHMVKISPKLVGLTWVSNHTLVTNGGRASVTVGVCTLTQKKSPSGGKETHSKLARYTDKPKQT